MYTIDDLNQSLAAYLPEDQRSKIHAAYEFGAQAHEGQTRLNGEPYITHPLQVASILAEMRMDADSIAAAILHDVIEDTGTAKEDLAKLFGQDVADLVDGVSKITQISFDTREEAQAEYFRKMLLAMSQDLRVILIKLADRLHNMRTIEYLKVKKRHRIARETLDIYAPIAQRLGMHQTRLELEELGFAALHPLRHGVLQKVMRKYSGNRKDIIQKIDQMLRDRLDERGVKYRIEGREKNLYSLYKKMKEKQLSFQEVYDVYGFRIIVDSIDTCYRTLGIVHNTLKPIPAKFKDYIAIPKENGYQSLHTALFSTYGVPVEIQIRTEEMHRLAEAGIAAHWLYKTKDSDHGSYNHQRARGWLSNLIEIQQQTVDSGEFLDNMRVDLFPDEVYVFTPKGKILALPRGATPVDFAYAVHSDVGNRCVAARIDRSLTALSTPLKNGSTVEIITAPSASPNPAWLNFVVTSRARSHIRHFLKHLNRDKGIELGARMLEGALAQLPVNKKLADIDDARKIGLVKEYGLESFDDVLEQVGVGNRIPQLVAKHLTDEIGVIEAPKSRHQFAFHKSIARWIGLNRSKPAPLAIKGTEGLVVSYARCCRPIPGDPIRGFVTKGKGIVIHTDSCPNVADYKKHPEQEIRVEWDEAIDAQFQVDIKIEAVEQRGVLAKTAAAISEAEANIVNVDMGDADRRYAVSYFTIEVQDRVHLAQVMRRLKALKEVHKISRRKG